MTDRTTKVLLLAITVLALSTGCAPLLQQNLTKTAALRPGMSTAEVKRIMGGPPAKSEFDHGVEEWHYCKTASSFRFGGEAVDEFVALFFKDDTLVATRNYSVSSKEMGFYGSCEKAVKHGDYRVPDQVLELRLK